ncbi:MAG TPA: toll/interleukin-1 receptor domain-containing protein [Ktedonobacterales bacterium]
MAQTRIFVSHSSKDNDWARPFAAALTAIGYDVWYDEKGLQGGDSWVASIQHEVETRDVFVLVLTPEAWESEWVQDELQLAIATRRRILPVLLRNTQVSGFLLTTQWITVIGAEPQAAARAAVLAIEAPPAPGRDAAPVATTETLDELIVLCRSLASEKRYTESLAACGRALALDPKSVNALRIKAWVLHQIGESRLEGRTWFQILMIDPREYKSSEFKIIFRALDNEHELLQAYSQLRSVTPYGTAEYDLLDGLSRLNRLEGANEVMRSITDNRLRAGILRHLGGLKQYDYAFHLVEFWYGSPPKMNTLSDLPVLDAYIHLLVISGRYSDTRRVHETIVRIFEAAYGNSIIRGTGRDKDSVVVRRGADEETYKMYLASLESIGRSKDADEMRKREG